MEAKYGEQIRRIRKEYGLTQSELAKRAGISLSSLQRYETNERQPTLQIINNLAAAIGISSNDFLWSSPSAKSNYFWMDELERKLKQVGCSIGFYEDDAYLWINYPDGTLEISMDDLEELHKSSNKFMLFLLDQLKKKYMQDFRPHD